MDLLEAMKIPYIILDMDEDEALAQIHEVIVSAYEKSVPHAIVVRKDTFDKYKLQKKQNNVYPLSREDALKLVIDHLHETDIVVLLQASSHVNCLNTVRSKDMDTVVIFLL